MKKWIRHQFRKKIRVYILPTKMGGYLNGLIFLMFLLALGYSNNLLLIFTIFLFSFNLMWLIQTHFHLHALKLDQVFIPEAHAGQSPEIKIFWNKVPKGPWDWSLKLESDRGDFELHHPTHRETESAGLMRVSQRGVHQWRHLRVQTSNPFGFYQVWIFYPLKTQSFVYPALLSSTDLNLLGQVLAGEIPIDKKGTEDFRGLVQGPDGEARKISWKHYARSGEILMKEGEDLRSSSLDIIYNPPENPELKEHYLSVLATQMVECHQRSIPFSLTTSHFTATAATDTHHLMRCLRELALC